MLADPEACATICAMTTALNRTALFLLALGIASPAAAQEQVATQTEEIRVLKAEVASLRAELEALKTEQATLQSELSALSAENRALRERCAEQEERLGAEASALKTISAALQAKNAEHVELDPTRTSLTGAVASFGLWKIGGNVRGGFGGHVRTPGFEINDLGFQDDADMSLFFANLRYHQFEPVSIFRNFSIGINPSIGWTTGGEYNWAQIGNFANAQFTNFWSGGWWMGWRPGVLNTVALRGGPAVMSMTLIVSASPPPRPIFATTATSPFELMSSP